MCEWLGMEVTLATFHNNGGASRIDLEAEAELLGRVQHPNIVTFFGYTYDEENQPGFLVTELMQQSLGDLIKWKKRFSSSYYPFTLPASIDILLQIVEAMIHVHECGVIHRDLKALNCLVNRKHMVNSKFQGYTVKLIDFGESKLRNSEMGSNFNTQNRGTRAWMSPEISAKEGDEIKEYTWSADVYSFGMTCYEILTGEEPFGTIRGRTLIEMVCAGHRPKIPDNCPSGLVWLMTKCWAQDPKDRPTFKDVQRILWCYKLSCMIWGTDSPIEFLPNFTLSP